MQCWIDVTHVCTSWRETALHCTQLWSHLHFPDVPQVIEELLARSKDAPLSITLRLMFDPRKSRRVLEDALLLGFSALHHVRKLLLYTDTDDNPTNEALQRLGGCTVPLLEFLHIGSNSSRSGVAALRSTISHMLSTCTLLSLSTDICCVDWTNTPFHSLTYLYAYKLNASSETSTAQSFLKALKGMPLLEELLLETVTGGVLAVRETLPSPITLPRLWCLRILYEQELFAAELLNSLHTPSLLHLEIGIKQSTGACAPLLTAMSQKVATLGPFLTFSSWSGGESFSAYRDALERPLEPKHDSTSEWSEQRVAALDVYFGVHAITLLPPLEVTTTLILEVGFPASGQEAWLSLTQGMESVTELRMNGGEYEEDIVATMLNLRHRALSDGCARFVLPKLDTVTLDGLVFPPEHDRLGDALAACFAERALEAAEIKTLRILHAQNLFEKDYERLRQVVPFMETDGHIECCI